LGSLQEFHKITGTRGFSDSEFELETPKQKRMGNVKDRAGGVDGVKNRSEKCKGSGKGGVDGVEPNIVEITHLCIMHGAHTSLHIYIPSTV
jgi:hypothetical protein